MGNVNNNKQRKHFFFKYVSLDIYRHCIFVDLTLRRMSNLLSIFIWGTSLSTCLHLSTKISDNTQEPTFVNRYCFHFWKSWNGVYRVNFQNLGCYGILDEKCLAQQNICIRLIAVNDTLTTACSIQDKRCRF